MVYLFQYFNSDPPPFIVGTNRSRAGVNTTLHCNSSHLTVNVTNIVWLKDRVVIQNSTSDILEIINPTVPKDNGSYSCKVFTHSSSQQQVQSKLFTLYIEGKSLYVYVEKIKMYKICIIYSFFY